MLFEIITLFPAMFDGPFSDSIIKRAVDKGLVRYGLSISATLRKTSTAPWTTRRTAAIPACF